MIQRPLSTFARRSRRHVVLTPKRSRSIKTWLILSALRDARHRLPRKRRAAGPGAAPHQHHSTFRSPTAATPLLRAAFPLLLRAAALHATPSPTPQSASAALLSRRRPRQSRTCRRRRRGGTGPRHAAGRSRRIWQPHRCVPLRVPAARATGSQPFWSHRPLHAARARRRR